MVKHGDFNSLAEGYAKYRPRYSESVAKIIISLVEKDRIDFVNVGAGTGIWTRMIADNPKINSTIAIDPSSEMRKQAMLSSAKFNIEWREGRGEILVLQVLVVICFQWHLLFIGLILMKE